MTRIDALAKLSPSHWTNGTRRMVGLMPVAILVSADVSAFSGQGPSRSHVVLYLAIFTTLGTAYAVAHAVLAPNKRTSNSAAIWQKLATIPLIWGIYPVLVVAFWTQWGMLQLGLAIWLALCLAVVAGGLAALVWSRAHAAIVRAATAERRNPAD
jgi:hypothetical protein